MCEAVGKNAVAAVRVRGSVPSGNTMCCMLALAFAFILSNNSMILICYGEVLLLFTIPKVCFFLKMQTVMDDVADNFWLSL